jgi:hypothetical protein
MFEVMTLFAHKVDGVAGLAAGPLTTIQQQKMLNGELHYGRTLSYV